MEGELGDLGLDERHAMDTVYRRAGIGRVRLPQTDRARQTRRRANKSAGVGNAGVQGEDDESDESHGGRRRVPENLPDRPRADT